VRRPIIWILVVALTHLSFVTSPAQVDKEVLRIAKIKGNVNKIGIDEKIQIKLLDGTKLKGRLTEIGDQYFVLIEDKSGDTRRITFAQAKQAGREVDTPFNDPKGWLAVALIPATIGISILVKDKK
jgi:small nuclear ribonucleoprotein (snRNP)-like protein